MSHALLIHGASGHGLVIADTAAAAGFDPIAWADDDPSKAEQSRGGHPVVATNPAEALAWLAAHQGQVVMGIGHNRIRARVAERYAEAGVSWATVVHPEAWVSPHAIVGEGTVIFAGAVVQTHAAIGRHVILNTACSVDHEGHVADHAHLSPGVHLGGNVTVGEGAHLGVGASVIQGITIGAWSTVGAGAAVVRDLPDHVVAYGVPARVQRSLD